jgi:hypothetical protein
MQHKLSQVRPHELARELAALPNLDVTALKQRWHSLYRTEPPARISRSLLFQAVAYRLQEQALGGLKSSTRRVLKRVAREANTRLSITEPPTRLSPGTVLVREWHGVNYRVTVLEDGALFHGKRYRSLSEVARQITGTQWSGPRFFGLKAPTKETGHGVR